MIYIDYWWFANKKMWFCIATLNNQRVNLLNLDSYDSHKTADTHGVLFFGTAQYYFNVPPTKWLQTGVFSKHRPSAVNQCAMAIVRFLLERQKEYTPGYFCLDTYYITFQIYYLHIYICQSASPLILAGQLSSFRLSSLGMVTLLQFYGRWQYFVAPSLWRSNGGPCVGGKRTRWIYPPTRQADISECLLAYCRSLGCNQL